MPQSDARPGRKSSYTEETGQKIIDEVKVCGSIKIACQNLGYKYPTVIRWKNNKADFAEGLRLAQLYFDRNSYSALRAQAQFLLVKRLFDGTIETRTVVQQTTTPEGEFTTTTTTTIKKEASLALIERFLGKPMDILDAVQLLGSHDMATQDQVEETYQTLKKSEDHIKNLFKPSTVEVESEEMEDGAEQS